MAHIDCVILVFDDEYVVIESILPFESERSWLILNRQFDQIHFSIVSSRSTLFHFHSIPYIARSTQTIKTSNSRCSIDLLISTYIYLYTHNKSKIYKRIYQNIPKIANVSFMEERRDHRMHRIPRERKFSWRKKKKKRKSIEKSQTTFRDIVEMRKKHGGSKNSSRPRLSSRRIPSFRESGRHNSKRAIIELDLAHLGEFRI